MSMTVEQVLEEAQKLNKQVAVHNQNNSKNEGMRMAKKQEIVRLFEAFNKKHGTQLTPDDTKGIETEYQNAAYGVYNESKHLKEVLKAIEEGDIPQVMALTGVDVSQDTLNIPRMHVDLDELEKQAGNSLKIQQEDTNLVTGIVGDTEQIVETNEEILEVTEDEAEEQQETDMKGLQSFFQAKVAEGEANQQATQLSQAVANQQSTIQVPKQEVEQTPVQEVKTAEAPKFNFGAETKKEEVQTPVQEEKKANAPVFSFGNVTETPVKEETPVEPKQETVEQPKQESTSGISFGVSADEEVKPVQTPSFGQAIAQNKEVVKDKEAQPRKGMISFNMQPKEGQEVKIPTPKPITGGANLEDALAQQGQSMPVFNIGADIDIEE
ncbi:hypothetical protein P4493_05715 [Bacillus thuringiensis]|uniref:Uncharacterized protein n=3 Tax=Bacillus thuringiensis TaxID=1428 RepID=A0A0B5N855_BACTU|nr:MULTISPECIES: hypothetical protein [Bacillus]MEC3431488.1 hypothetical protein [Bacillus cereus]MED1153961.1 hypothetical protein [Bacillus paranthracis]OUB09200.1 hypothetical protein BK708_32200 [Bacillus thuringiensis serovar yunnanensis]AFQ29833.1 hypothetical protein BTF1_28662 [Bacillus thuringiensis HD-789]AJG73939.1 hypothetical protein BF38_6077 [Bacillus thuringiensis]